eukprot:m.52035 g.52035  ORF g.52035 m.52035 type:complete len:141 (+) comp7597_c0_seq1:280-702(+)
MFRQTLADHQQKKLQRKRTIEHLRKETLQCTQEFSAALVEDVNKEISAVFSNQRQIEDSLQEMQAAIQRQSKTAIKWASSINKFNQSLKELGDVENWAMVLEADMKKIVEVIQFATSKDESPSVQVESSQETPTTSSTAA